jgi:hypothetical protein
MSEGNVPEGAKIRYHGSIHQYKGREGEVIRVHPCYSGSGEIKYTLWFGPGMQDGVQNIRRTSFDVLEDE